MKRFNYLILLTLALPASAMAFGWNDLWQTPDQQALKLLQKGNAGAAAQVFKDKNWQAVSHYRSGNYKDAYTRFGNTKTSDGQYNSGNAAAYMGKYQEAITAYDKAIAMNPNNQDAVTNREIVKKLLQQQQQQQQNQKNQDKNQDQKNQNQKSQDQQNQDQKNQDQKSQAQKNQNQQKQDQKNQDQSKQNQDKQDQNNKDQQKQDQNNQQNSSQNQNKQNSPENKDQNNQQPQNQASSENQQKSQPQPQDEYAPATTKRNQQEENNKQLLRRLSDDPGGLLQQKFLRDYARRHGVDDNDNQGAVQ